MSKTDIKKDFFEDLKQELKNKNYVNKSNTYLDQELSSVLSMIKRKTNIPIAMLLSHIVESWVAQNKDQINNLPKNPYLS